MPCFMSGIFAAPRGGQFSGTNGRSAFCVSQTKPRPCGEQRRGRCLDLRGGDHIAAQLEGPPGQSFALAIEMDHLPRGCYAEHLHSFAGGVEIVRRDAVARSEQTRSLQLSTIEGSKAYRRAL